MTPNGSSLAPHAHDWTGGNINGLRDLAETLHGYLPHVQDLIGRLSVVARGLTSDGPGGWQGKAATAFTEAWSRQIATANALQEYITAIAQAIASLAVELSQIESALENEAYLAARHGVRIADNGSVTGYAGATGLQTALEYRKVFAQAQAEADQARDAAAEQLYGLYQEVFNPNPHLNGADANTAAALLADLAATPAAHRRDITSELKKLRGRDLNLREEIAEARKAGQAISPEAAAASGEVDQELQEVERELKDSAKTENALTSLLDTRASDIEGYLAGQAGSGRHVKGNTPKDLQAAAREEEPRGLQRAIEIGNDIPVVDVFSTLAGTGIGMYYDVRNGQSPVTALGDETISNVAETATGAAAGEAAAEWGADVGMAGGPLGIVAGTVVGYGVGDFTHDVLTESWGQDIHAHGVASGILYGTGHSEFEVGDDVRELGVAGGHEVEHLWDETTGGDLPEHQVLGPYPPKAELVRKDSVRRVCNLQRTLAQHPRLVRHGVIPWCRQPYEHSAQFGTPVIPVAHGHGHARGHHRRRSRRPEFRFHTLIGGAP